ncbi:MAG: tRNA (adenosine(37)-N6)-dimethylallyltransferase MiaA [Salinivirgaceae bacterium]|nr:tRNA (adenosine(37)-N6)-dimethylallyltransferase MiaA [Salinivirgaceae bacterium]
MNNSTNKLITILGPTATGKTSFAANLAYCLNAEIISADSRQVYIGMDLGTGKDLKDYFVNDKKIAHHLVDIVDAGEKYNVFKFQSDFLKAYDDISSRNKIPILCGGSGMYIEAILKGYKLISVPVNESLRNELDKFSLEELAARLSEIKHTHNTSDADTKKRAIRAIEIETYYTENPDFNFSYPTFKALLFGLKFDRSTIKERITERLKERLREGMIDEVQNLLDKGVPAEVLIYYGLEYKFITKYLTKEYNYNTMVDKLNVAIHQFSKRQMTWFRKMERSGFNIHWIDGYTTMEEKIKIAMEIIQKES